MPRRSSLEQILDDLAAVRRDPGAPDVRDRILAGLSAQWNAAVGKAASVIAEHRPGAFGDALIAAFERMMIDPAKRDPHCAATTEIVKALYETDTVDDDAATTRVFLRGLRHHQFDGSLNERGRVSDSAGALRGHCGLALLAARHRDALVALVDLLGDSELPARSAAVRGLASTGREEAAWVLRLKLATGAAAGEDADLLGECMSGLLRIDPRRSLPLVEGYLRDDTRPELSDAAAMALGQSRHAEALGLLTARLDRVRADSERRGVLFTAIAMLRSDAAAQTLVRIVEDGSVDAAADAVRALALYRRDDALRRQLAAIVEGRDAPPLSRAFASAFKAD